MPDETAIQSLAYFTEGGSYRVPADSGMGGLNRPFATGQDGSQVATLETLYDFWINNVPNPNEALAADPDFRTKIRMHWDVGPALEKRQITVASYPDRIEPNPLSKSPAEAKVVAEYVESVWRQIPELPKLYQQMQLAVSRGGIGIEFMWRREQIGDATIERPFRWESVDQSRFVFDRLGNMSLLTRTEPVWGAYVAANPHNWQKSPIPASRFPLGKFIYHMHKKEPGTWERPELEGYKYYGLGLDVQLYYIVTFDIFGQRMRMKMLEKYGMPPVDVYYPSNESGSKLRRIVDSVRGESVATIPHTPGALFDDLYKIVPREFPKMSFDAFENLSKWTAEKVDKIVFGSAEESQKSDGGRGGFSDAVQRRDTGAQIYNVWDAKNISTSITDQLIPAIAYQRFPNLPASDLPLLRLEPKEERDRAQESDIIEKSSKIISIAKAEAYERLGFREPKEGEAVIEQQQPQQPGQSQPPSATPGTPKVSTPIGSNGGKAAVANRGITMPRDGSV